MTHSAKFWTSLAVVGAIAIMLVGFAVFEFLNGLASYATHSPGGSGAGGVGAAVLLLALVPSAAIAAIFVTRSSARRKRKLFFALGWITAIASAVAFPVLLINASRDFLLLGATALYPIGMAGMLISLREAHVGGGAQNWQDAEP